MAGWIDGAPSWSHGIYDFGLLYNEQTGWQRVLQCHITVCKQDSRSGANVHISMYNTQGAEISVYRPNTAWAKLYYYPDQNGALFDNGGPRSGFIRNMPCFDVIKPKAFECFYEKYPNLRPQAPLALGDESQWPSL
ncbi:hypothetical protein KPL78_11955 [Roseomonas sp. HJA6]|uniref:CNP1-like uncharacterized domain-containing protein n=1 Tax=Roseomonas alba TaxID=2846776 RepID=A0ABS7A8C9_9PROT|nr:hypothetical protein [Neoroseomonas alba]MBW6398568.1 hypothetical protein [Neoroseomonas alba]